MEMAVMLTRFSSLTAGGWTKAARDEWQKIVLDELAEMPYLLTMPALREAGRNVEFPGKLVVWVTAQIRDRWAKLRLEQETYERLLEIANVT